MEVKKHQYFVPELNEVADVLERGLKAHFKSVSVSIAPCPNLTQAPFHLAGEGLCGSQRICDVGGVPYLVPLAQPEKVYNYDDIARQAGVPNGFMVGAGAGPCHVIGTNSELMPNIRANGRNETHYAKIGDNDECVMEKVPQGNRECCLMSNIFLSEGLPGNVLKIKLQGRTGSDNLTTAIRNILAEKYGDKPVGLGGVFLITKGKAKLHVMPAFSKVPLTCDEEVHDWLRFFEFEAPLICLSIMSSCDPGWDLRIDHTHCFSTHGAGGHYHYDTTPDDVEYECYFNLAEYLIRIDQPKVTHQIGRD